ncbi:MAG: hypothetical protein ABI210_11605 [Abditibacteriaceae bacterium]
MIFQNEIIVTLSDIIIVTLSEVEVWKGKSTFLAGHLSRFDFAQRDKGSELSRFVYKRQPPKTPNSSLKSEFTNIFAFNNIRLNHKLPRCGEALRVSL